MLEHIFTLWPKEDPCWSKCIFPEKKEPTLEQVYSERLLPRGPTLEQRNSMRRKEQQRGAITD